MKCPKCKGLMYTERFMDFDGMFDLWKCINCGALADPVIFQNQRLSAQIHAAATVPVPDDTDEEEPLAKPEKKLHYAVTSRS